MVYLISIYIYIVIIYIYIYINTYNYICIYNYIHTINNFINVFSCLPPMEGSPKSRYVSKSYFDLSR